MTDTYEVVCDSTDRDRWLEERAKLLCASEVACLFGEGYTSALRLWGMKTGRLREAEARRRELLAEHFYWGHKLEPVILDAYRERTGRDVHSSGLLLRHKDYPWIGATLDGLTEHEDWKQGPLEIKLGNPFRQAREWAGGEPRKFFWQSQTQAGVFGSRGASLACFTNHPGLRFFWTDAVAQEEAFDAIVERSARFMRHVTSGEEPPVTEWHEDLGDTVAELFPEDDGASIELPEEFNAVAEERERAASAQKAAKRMVELCDAKLKLAIGSAQMGTLSNGMGYKWGTYQRKEYTKTIPASTYRQLRPVKPRG